MSKKQTPPTEPDHPSEDRTGRFPLDALLRRHGWRIAKRKGITEALWMREGERVSFRSALEALDKSGELSGEEGAWLKRMLKERRL